MDLASIYLESYSAICIRNLQIVLALACACLCIDSVARFIGIPGIEGSLVFGRFVLARNNEE